MALVRMQWSITTLYSFNESVPISAPVAISSDSILTPSGESSVRTSQSAAVAVSVSHPTAQLRALFKSLNVALGKRKQPKLETSTFPLRVSRHWTCALAKSAAKYSNHDGSYPSLSLRMNSHFPARNMCDAYFFTTTDGVDKCLFSAHLSLLSQLPFVRSLGSWFFLLCPSYPE